MPTIIEEMKEYFNLYIKNGKLNCCISRQSFLKTRPELIRNLQILDNILPHLKNKRISEKLYCLYNNISEFPTCLCGNIVTRFEGNLKNGFYGKYCSKSCSNRYTNLLHPERYKQETFQKIRMKRIENGSYFPSVKSRKKMSVSAKSDSVKKKKEETCLKRYGVKNAGVLGAYSSKEATNFIKNFINENNISENRCYFHSGGVNSKEFYQMVYSQENKKYIYMSYDLVIFKTAEAAKQKDLSQIELVLEYNGPWHYTETEVMLIGYQKATPYKKSKTVREAYEFDRLKEDHMNQYTNNYIIHWWYLSKLKKLSNI